MHAALLAVRQLPLHNAAGCREARNRRQPAGLFPLRVLYSPPSRRRNAEQCEYNGVRLSYWALALAFSDRRVNVLDSTEAIAEQCSSVH